MLIVRFNANDDKGDDDAVLHVMNSINRITSRFPAAFIASLVGGYDSKLPLCHLPNHKLRLLAAKLI